MRRPQIRLFGLSATMPSACRWPFPAWSPGRRRHSAASRRHPPRCCRPTGGRRAALGVALRDASWAGHGERLRQSAIIARQAVRRCATRSAGEDFDELTVEGRDVFGLRLLLARPPHLLVHPGAAGVVDVVASDGQLVGVRPCARPAESAARRRGRSPPPACSPVRRGSPVPGPWPGCGSGPELITPGQQQGVVVVQAGVFEGAVDAEGVGWLVMVPAAHLAGLVGKESLPWRRRLPGLFGPVSSTCSKPSSPGRRRPCRAGLGHGVYIGWGIHSDPGGCGKVPCPLPGAAFPAEARPMAGFSGYTVNFRPALSWSKNSPPSRSARPLHQCAAQPQIMVDLQMEQVMPNRT